MSSNHHAEAGTFFSRLSYEYEWRNECRALSFTANPKKFLAETFCFVEPRAELAVLLWVWVQLDESVKSRSTYVAARMAHRLFLFSFSLGSAKTNKHACYLLYWTFDQAFYPCRIGTTALRSNSGAAAGQQLPYTDIDSFFVPGPTSQAFAGWSEVSLFW